MKRLTRRINARLLKKLSALTGVTLIWLLLFMVAQPIYTFATQIVYFMLGIMALLRMWEEALKYESGMIIV